MTLVCVPVKRNSTLLRQLWASRTDPRNGPLPCPITCCASRISQRLVTLVWLVVALALLLQYWTQTARDPARHRRRHAAGRRCAPGSPARAGSTCTSARVQPPDGYDSALVAADRCRARRLAVSVRPVHRSALGRAADARVVAAAVAAADHRRHGRDRLAHRRPRSRDGGAAARARRRAGLSAVHAGPDRSSQCPDRARRCWSLAAAAWSDRKSWTAAAAGLLTGLALAIGFESLPYLAVCGGMLALRYVFDPEAGAASARLRPGACRGTALALFISVGPDRLTLHRCDAIASTMPQRP